MNKITYSDAFMEALGNKELVRQYDRIFEGCLENCINSSIKGGINFEIDKATGFTKSEIEKFRDFFEKYILIPTIINE